MTRSGFKVLAKAVGELIKIDLGEQLFDRLGAHARLKVVLVFFAHIVVFLLVKDLVLRQIAAVAGVGDDVLGEVEHVLEHLRRDVEHQGDP